MNTDAYTTAILSLIRTGGESKAVLASARTVLERRGHQKLYPRILRSLERILASKDIADGVTVTVASDAALKKYKKEIESEIKRCFEDKAYTTQEDETIIGGYVLHDTNRTVDKTFKTQLQSVYERATQ